MRFDWRNDETRQAALARPRGRADTDLLSSVRAILDDVRERGWSGMADQSTRIDGVRPQRLSIAPYAAAARNELGASALEAMALAVRNIESFHRQTLPQDVEVYPAPGLRVAKEWRPVRRVGLYVPGGVAPLFSTLMMLAIPARVAGVRDITVVTPPRPDGGLDPALALAADLCGIEAIWTVGGAQAIGALAYGAGDIPAVDLICGPGNAWVAAAKAIVSAMPGGPGIDLPAGPSELMVIADDSAQPAWVAADLLSQAEHDGQAQVILVSTSPSLIGATLDEFARQASAIGLAGAQVRAIKCEDIAQAIDIANRYAPEHLSLACQDADRVASEIVCAGAVFVGHWAAESFGDYLVGSSHVLPTDGAARFTGGVSTQTFMKAITVQRLSPDIASALAAPAAALARLEGLEAHARAAEARAVV
jgi:histidinol dehydrogenase